MMETSQTTVDTATATEMVECGCCYGDFPTGEVKECDARAGHFVCKECLCSFVSEQIYGNNSIEFKCIVHADCRHVYNQSAVLDDVLPPTLKKHAYDAIYRVTVEQAAVEGAWTCEKCSHIGFLEKDYPSVHCPGCNIEYCTYCKKVYHDGTNCKEAQEKVENDAKDKARVLAAYEKMSEAVIRRCPSCKTRFTKWDGCNKVTCPKCNTKSCYLCGVPVEDYSHFCDHKFGKSRCPSCGKACELWTATEKMLQHDEEARLNAGREVLNDIDIAPEEKERILK
mmetsp:Transcript_835/g.1519  ORF Transcript_835/g.1519 Transcript_835/m.1519 type:complete len:282 (+) Transcript_835:150-995(+)